MGLAPGTNLGPYEIQAAVGAGGMGQVYRARDARLDRIVAIKVLPDSIASDPEARLRLEREAQAISSLTHPHICTLYDIGTQEGQTYLVMEYLEGQTLAERLASKPLSFPDALTLGVQIARALDKAHRAGIVHRDLKPANVMLVKHGNALHAKLLDFGIAKALPGAGAARRDESTLPTVAAATGHGVIVGTLQYMAPEQLEGRNVDARTDMFAFGALLYEMVTGRKAFEGSSQASIIAAIVERHPSPVSHVQALAPAALDRVVARCLAKDPDGRWQSAADLASELEWIAMDEREPTGFQTRTSRLRIPAMAGLGAAILLLIAATVGWIAASADTAPSPSLVTRVAFARPEGTSVTNLGRPAIAISPDGRKVVFVADYQLYLRDLSESEARPIPGTESLGEIMQPFFSPDGEWVGFIDGLGERRSIRKIPVHGGASVVIAPAGGEPMVGFGATWDLDGEILFANGDGVFAVSGDGGTPKQVISLADGEYAIRPQRLPDRDHLLFTLADGDPSHWDRIQIVIQSISSGERQVVVRDGSDGRYVPTGHITYVVGTDLLAVRFDAAIRRVAGAPVVVERNIYRPTGGVRAIGQLAIASSGSLAIIPNARASTTLTFVNTSTGATGRPPPFSAATYPRISPDGRRVTVIEDGGTWVYALDGSSAPVRVAREDSWTRWIDSTRIAIEIAQTDRLEAVNADGSGKRQPLAVGRMFLGRSSDGAMLTGGLTGTWIERGGADRKPLWTDAELGGSVSPDGKWIAFYRREGPQHAVYVGLISDPGSQYRVSKQGGHHPLWSRDGRRLYFAANSTGPVTSLMVVDVQTAPTISFSDPRLVVEELLQPLNQDRQYDVTPDDRILALLPDPRRSTRSGEIMVVLNWAEDLKRLAAGE